MLCKLKTSLQGCWHTGKRVKKNGYFKKRGKEREREHSSILTCEYRLKHRVALTPRYTLCSPSLVYMYLQATISDKEGIQNSSLKHSGNAQLNSYLLIKASEALSGLENHSPWVSETNPKALSTLEKKFYHRELPWSRATRLTSLLPSHVLVLSLLCLLACSTHLSGYPIPSITSMHHPLEII